MLKLAVGRNLDASYKVRNLPQGASSAGQRRPLLVPVTILELVQELVIVLLSQEQGIRRRYF